MEAFLDRISNPAAFEKRLTVKDALTQRFEQDIDSALAA